MAAATSVRKPTPFEMEFAEAKERAERDRVMFQKLVLWMIDKYSLYFDKEPELRKEILDSAELSKTCRALDFKRISTRTQQILSNMHEKIRCELMSREEYKGICPHCNEPVGAWNSDRRKDHTTDKYWHHPCTVENDAKKAQIAANAAFFAAKLQEGSQAPAEPVASRKDSSTPVPETLVAEQDPSYVRPREPPVFPGSSAAGAGAAGGRKRPPDSKPSMPDSWDPWQTKPIHPRNTRQKTSAQKAQTEEMTNRALIVALADYPFDPS